MKYLIMINHTGRLRRPAMAIRNPCETLRVHSAADCSGDAEIGLNKQSAGYGFDRIDLHGKARRAASTSGERVSQFCAR